MLIVLHTSPHSVSALPEILSRAGALQAVHPQDGAPLEKGVIYIAPPNFHLIVADGFLRVLQGPRENLHRPAVDPLFRSAAASYGARVIGVILSGALDDGTSGLMIVRAGGGETIVQDPATATFSSMPSSALEQVPESYVVGPEEIGQLLVQLTRQELPASAVAQRPPEGAVMETRIAEFDMSEIENDGRRGEPSAFACPDCGGVLWEIVESGFLRFRCRVGHAFTAKYLEAEQRHLIETALWAALRALEESASLSGRMANRAGDQHHSGLHDLYEERMVSKRSHARILREFLLQVNSQEDSEEELGKERSPVTMEPQSESKNPN